MMMHSTVGFESLSLPDPILKGVRAMGFSKPTLIQEAAIPILKSGRDLVAMARTGSGKTAAFVLPLLAKLNCSHSVKVGCRAIIIAPTRELSAQISAFLELFCKKASISIRCACILGGDSLSEQFSLLMSNPDILVGTPGRLLHLFAEIASQSDKQQQQQHIFSTVNTVVIDEADRMFEDRTSLAQVELILSKIPKDRQIALFSATIPSQLISFSKTGLIDPALIRQDVDSQLSPNLKCLFFDAQLSEKPAMLLSILEGGVSIGTSLTGGIIFVATRHVAEFLSIILTQANISHGLLYGQMDAEARKVAIGKFQKKEVPLLLVTDVASRGIDIPSLEFIINYDFPCTPKLFIHRAGRVARAGRPGTAISFVCNDERPFLVELNTSLTGTKDLQLVRMVPIGSLSLAAVKSRIEFWVSSIVELGPALKAASNSMVKYQRVRPKPSPAVYSKAKLLPSREQLPVYSVGENDTSGPDLNFLSQLANFRPSETVFEVMRKCSRGERAKLHTGGGGDLTGINAIRKLKEKRTKLNGTTLLVAKEKDIISKNTADTMNKEAGHPFLQYQKAGLELQNSFSLLNDEMNIGKESHARGHGEKPLIQVWDSKKKKYVSRRPFDTPFTLLEKRFFSKTADKNSQNQIGEVYSSWKKATHMELPRIGSLERDEHDFLIKKRTKAVDYRSKRKSKHLLQPLKLPEKPSKLTSRALELSLSTKSSRKNRISSELKDKDQIIKSRNRKTSISERLSFLRRSKKKKASSKP